MLDDPTPDDAAIAASVTELRGRVERVELENKALRRRAARRDAPADPGEPAEPMPPSTVPPEQRKGWGFFDE